MENDKAWALKEPATKRKLCVANFDLQKVLTTPCTQVSSLYYMSKLSVWNFTIFDLGTKEGLCHVWNETTGCRGANEIASCLGKFIEDKASKGITEFVFYSDNCGGQNRNKIVFSMYIHKCRTLDVKITHR